MGNLNVYSPTIPLETTTQYDVDTTYSTIYIYWSSAVQGLQYGLIRAQELGLIGKTLVITTQGSANRLAFWSCSQEHPYPSEANISVSYTHTYDSTTQIHTYNVTPQTNGNYVLITGSTTANRSYVAIPTTDITITAPWVDANCHTIPAAPQLVNTNETRSINVQGRYSGSSGWTFAYGLSNSFATSDTLKYLPSSLSQWVVKILVPSSIQVGFFYGTVSGATLTPQGTCSMTSTVVDNKILYTVTIPANKVCFVTKWFKGSSGASSSNNYYEGFVPDDISVDNDWIIGAFHKFNGTSWD